MTKVKTMKDFAFLDENIPALEKLERLFETVEKAEVGSLFLKLEDLEEIYEKVEDAVLEVPPEAEPLLRQMLDRLRKAEEGRRAEK